MKLKKINIIIILLFILAAFAVAYHIKDRVGINIFPHRHLILFKE